MDAVTSRLTILLIVTCYPHFSFGLTTYYMKEHCGQTLSLKKERTNSMSLVLTSKMAYDANMNCYVIVRAEPGHKIMTSFEWLDVSSFRHCPGDFLEILDCPYTQNKSSSKCITSSRICGQRNPDVMFVSHNDSITVRFVSDGEFFGKGFHIVLTQFHDGPCSSDGAEFTCANGRCVHSGLACSSWWTQQDLNFDHCGDQSNHCRLPALVIACIVLAVVVFLIVVFLVSVVVWYRVRGVKREDRDEGTYDEDFSDGVDNQGRESVDTGTLPRHQDVPTTSQPMTSTNRVYSVINSPGQQRARD